ncbi:MAG: hypothetical protein ABSG32_10960 [Terriglobia bacterium]|jgi:hypothetical protein
MSTRLTDVPLYSVLAADVEGVSEESRQISRLLASISFQQRTLASSLWKDSLIEEISQVSQTCNEQGWDGYNAEPLSSLSAIRATELLELLPNDIQIPNVVPDPGGDISFEWHAGSQNDFTLGVTGQSLVYAGIFGGSSETYGEERFSRVLPLAVLGILRRYFSEV